MAMVSRDSSSKDSASRVMHQYACSDMVVGPTSFQDHGSAFNWDGQSGNVLTSVHSLGDRICKSMDFAQAMGTGDSEMFRQRHLMNLQAGKDPDFSSALGQGLSLSLGSHLPSDMLIPSFNYGAERLVNQVDRSYLTSSEEPRVHIKQIRGDCSFCGDGTVDNTFSSSSTSHNHFGSVLSNEVAASLTIQSSRYLKPAQSLLEEVVSVRKAAELESDKQSRKDKSIGRILQDGTEAGKPTSDQRRNALSSNAFSSANKHEIQIKITKLVALLDQVNSRYQQYCHQMEEVVSSFEVITGQRSAKSYTTLALKAMSRHFCSLRNAIVTQICAARQCLKEDSPRNLGNLAQLSLFDHNAKQKRTALQKLGIIPTQQAWKPLRGLPENSVAILRAWLFEHFLHPYPNDSEKLMLATQTGLTRNQVSNWFINARVRLWKPMIEEMYREIDEASIGSSSSTDNTTMIWKGVS